MHNSQDENFTAIRKTPLGVQSQKEAPRCIKNKR